MLERIRQLLFGTTPQLEPFHATAPGEQPAPVAPRVLVIIHDPPVEQYNNRRLHQVLGWNDPAQLAQQYIRDLRDASYGYVNYQIAKTIDAPWYAPKIDGFRYTNESFLQAWHNRAFHQPDAIDYPAQVRAFNLIERYNAGQFDEAWFFAHPYSGDYESTMVGPGAFWCNSPPVAGTGHAKQRFVIMAFNYERDVDCMLENFGHRAESIMSRLYERLPAARNMWSRFIQYDQVAPGRAECGNVHFAPNSQRDYDWGNRRPVPSACDDWYTYPHLPGNTRLVDCGEWGNGDMRLHHLWWFRHFPHTAGSTDGMSNNWWEYILDPNRVP